MVDNTSFEDMRKEVGGVRLELVARPEAEVERVYEGLLELYRACEEQVVRSCGNKRGVVPA